MSYGTTPNITPTSMQQEVGETIPPYTNHAVSVALPTWAANVAYEEGEPWVANNMKSGYPRFCIHFQIKDLVDRLKEIYCYPEETLMLFPSKKVVCRAREFIETRSPQYSEQLRVITLAISKKPDVLPVTIFGLIFPDLATPTAKEYWQHTGEGVSSRLAEYFEMHYFQNPSKQISDTSPANYVEERFGRNLDISMVTDSKLSLRKRIAAETTAASGKPLGVENVFLYPTGMTAIFSAHRLLWDEGSPGEFRWHRSICFQFPYTDTLKILQKFGAGVKFYPRGTSAELDELEAELEAGKVKYGMLFCEVPGNPLLHTPDLERIRKLADKFGFLVVVDDTVGNMCNIDIMPYADISVCSLTKIFSGDCNVMGGCLIMNPESKHYSRIRSILNVQYEDNFWAQDALYLERNSRDFSSRNSKTNVNAMAIVDFLSASPLVDQVYHPSVSATKANYDKIKKPNGGYSGLLSVVFKKPELAVAFFDNIKIAKGPSLGTNFTLACPYTIIAHYNELEFVESCGISRSLVRISVGLEELEDLLSRLNAGLEAASKIWTE